MSGAIAKAELGRRRLAAQRLTRETAAADATTAARAVVGIQAQDPRAAALALRSRVPGLNREEIAAAPLVRTWTVRGTAHLLAADDLPWLHALTGLRNRRYFDGLMGKRGNLDLARSMLGDMVELLGDQPLTRAGVLAELTRRGHASLGERSVNVVMAWAAASGHVIGLADGRFRAADPPEEVEVDEALTILARRYLAGYGPAAPEDLARWSGLPLGTARRAFESAGQLESAGELLALPGTLEHSPPPAPPALLLAAYDTSMLGWRSREPLVAAANDRHVLSGGGVIRPVVLARGSASGTWRLEGSARSRKLRIERFGRAPSARALGAEMADVGRFLGIELELNVKG